MSEADTRAAPSPLHLDGRRVGAIGHRLLEWYAQHARDLPWRRSRDPYAIWVSEIMLQQTQVDTVRPYFARWMQAFPDCAALAQAHQDDVLRLWEGLGYYSRARNLQRAARDVMARHAGQLPASIEALRALPGIGPYTAAAIASIAFDIDAAVVDGNVKRVLARLTGYDQDVKSPRGVRDLQALADRLVPPGRAGDYNQAVMDLGATVCTPRQPACERCPLTTLCVARRQGLQGQLPRTARRPAPPTRRALIAVVVHGDQVWVIRRDATLLGGLWAFPSIDMHEHGAASAEHDLVTQIETFAGRRPAHSSELLAEVKHTYTHFKLIARVLRFDLAGDRPRPSEGQWAHIMKLNDLAMGKVDRRVAQALMEQCAAHRK